MRPPASATLTPRYARQSRTPLSYSRLQSARGSGSAVRYSPYRQQHGHERPELASAGVTYDQNEAQESVTVNSVQGYRFTQDSAQHSNESIPTAVHGIIRPGRKLGPIWQHFKKLGSNSHPLVECLGCHMRIGSGIPKRNMIPHVLECDSISALDKLFIRTSYEVSSEVTVAPSLTTPIVTSSVRSPDVTSVPNTPLTQTEFDLIVARVWYMNALPFILVESPILILLLLFFKLAPHLKLPSRYKLSNVLLSQVRDEIEVSVLEKIKCQGAVTVTTDGYTNKSESSTINFMVTAPGMKSLFWSCLHIGSVQPTAQYLAGELGRVVNEIQSKTGAIIGGFLSDGATNMDAAWEIFKAKLPVFDGGCATRMLNLVMEEVFSNIAFIMQLQEQAHTVSRLVRDHIGLLEEFGVLPVAMIPKKQTNHGLMIPGSTRWYSQHLCLKSVLSNRKVLKDLFCSSSHKILRDRFSTAEVEAIVASTTFWDRLSYVVVMIDPIIEALGVLESGEAEPSRVYERFRWLVEGYSTKPLNPPYPEETRPPHRAYGEPIPDARGQIQRHVVSAATRKLVRSQIKAIVEKYWDKCYTDAMGIAFLLDPNTNISLFEGSDAIDSINQACTYAERSKMLDRLNLTRQELKRDLYDFEALKTRWSAEQRARNAGVQPRSWWKVNRNVDVMHRNLSYIADIVFSISTSSTASESIRDYIHSKRSKCLGTEKGDMLSYIYMNGGRLHSERSAFARIQSNPESDVVDLDVF